MNRRRIVRSLLLGVLFVLAAGPHAYAQETRLSGPFARQGVALPPSAPEKEHLDRLSVLTIAPEAEIIASVGLYDDPETPRPVDYVELYDGAGSLIGVSWLDRHGILRMAVDRGLFEGDPTVLEGVLVLVPQGTSL